MSRKDVEPALERLTLRRFAAEDGTELLDLPGLPLPDADTPAPVRFLPHLGRDAARPRPARADPARGAPREQIFHTKMPQSIGTFLVDGAVAGTWRPDGTIEPFEDLSEAQRSAGRGRSGAALAEFSA